MDLPASRREMESGNLVGLGDRSDLVDWSTWALVEVGGQSNGAVWTRSVDSLEGEICLRWKDGGDRESIQKVMQNSYIIIHP